MHVAKRNVLQMTDLAQNIKYCIFFGSKTLLKKRSEALSSLCITYFVLCRGRKPRSHRKKINLLTKKWGIKTKKWGIKTKKWGIKTIIYF
jgi:hypothetical protein